MTTTAMQSLRIQLEEAIQMLRLVAREERTCMEVAEWLDQNYPEDNDNDSNTIVNLLMNSGSDNV